MQLSYTLLALILVPLSMFLLARRIAILCVLTFITHVEAFSLLATTCTNIIFFFGARDVQIFHIISARGDMLVLFIARVIYLLGGGATTHYDP